MNSKCHFGEQNFWDSLLVSFGCSDGNGAQIGDSGTITRDTGMDADVDSVTDTDGDTESANDPDCVFRVSCTAPQGTDRIGRRRSGDAANTIWFAPRGTTDFAESSEMTSDAGEATRIAVPALSGPYKLYVVNSHCERLGESDAQLRVD